MRKKEVKQATKLSDVTIWRLERAGKFPKRRKLSANAVGWLRSEVLEWMQSRPVIEKNELPINDIAWTKGPQHISSVLTNCIERIMAARGEVCDEK